MTVEKRRCLALDEFKDLEEDQNSHFNKVFLKKRLSPPPKNECVALLGSSCYGRPLSIFDSSNANFSRRNGVSRSEDFGT